MPETNLTPDDIHAGVVFRAPFLTLGDKIALEIKRNLDLIELYTRMPYEPGASPYQRQHPATATGPAIAMLKRDVVEAVHVCIQGHVGGMVAALHALENNRPTPNEDKPNNDGLRPLPRVPRQPELAGEEPLQLRPQPA